MFFKLGFKEILVGFLDKGFRGIPVELSVLGTLIDTTAIQILVPNCVVGWLYFIWFPGK